jgi:(+)-trans-carveol dehydrogenase
MPGLEGKVALITGAARGQGRAVALRLARDGADIVALDIAQPDDGLPYKLGSADDLAETRAQVEALGRRVISRAADVRERADLDAAVAQALEAFGGIDIVVANAGVGPSPQPSWEISREDWDRIIDINLTGVWQTVSSVVPAMIERGKGGSIICTTSTAGTAGYGYLAAYVSSKHGVQGLVKTLANELGTHSIRVNAVAPTVVNTPLFSNPMMYRILRPDLDNPTQSDAVDVTRQMHLLPIPYIEPEDVANAAGWLASDEARYVSGTTILVDGGQLAKM